MSEPIYSVTIMGKPQTWKRMGHNRKTGARYRPEAYDAWKQVAALQMRTQRAALGLPSVDHPVTAHVDVIHEKTKARPTRMSAAAWANLRAGGLAWHDGTPDLDNLAKASLDALQAAGVLEDDARIVELRARKMYGAIPRVVVRLYAAPDIPPD